MKALFYNQYSKSLSKVKMPLLPFLQFVIIYNFNVISSVLIVQKAAIQSNLSIGLQLYF